MEFKPEYSAILAGLFLFGIGYNWLIGWAERKHLLEGYTALAVALGTLVTLAGVAIVDLRAAIICLIAFAASGAPMIGGSLGRYFTARAREREYERQAKRMAEHSERGEG